MRPRRSFGRRRVGGFTLIELVIAMVVAAILAAIAIPSYRSFVLRGNRAVARTALVELATLQERRYLQTRNYATTSLLPLTGIDSTTVYLSRDGSKTATAGPQSIYSVVLSVPAGGNPPYLLTATATGSQSDDSDCKVLTLDAAGTRSARDAADTTSPTITATCWKR